LGLSIKDVRSQEGGGDFSSVNILRTRGGSSDADVRTFWCKKLWIFRNLWCVPTDKGNRGSIFRDFVRTFPLETAKTVTQSLQYELFIEIVGKETASMMGRARENEIVWKMIRNAMKSSQWEIKSRLRKN